MKAFDQIFIISNRLFSRSLLLPITSSCSRWFHGSGVSTLFFSINLENPISVLYSTQFHPQRNPFPPFPRPLWGTLAHPERTGAALDSSKANAPPWYFSAARLRGPSGETTAHRDLLRGCWQNQYNKLLGIVRITLREFGSDRIQYSKVLEMII